MLHVDNSDMARKKRPPQKKRMPNRVLEFRTARELTQEKLAEMSGLTASSISQIENGKQAMSDESREAIARALGRNPADLLPPDPDSPTAIFAKIKPEDQQLALNLLKQFIDR